MITTAKQARDWADNKNHIHQDGLTKLDELISLIEHRAKQGKYFFDFSQDDLRHFKIDSNVLLRKRLNELGYCITWGTTVITTKSGWFKKIKTNHKDYSILWAEGNI
jgi:hypothetical protein